MTVSQPETIVFPPLSHQIDVIILVLMSIKGNACLIVC
jgi:hypothetical protein